MAKNYYAILGVSPTATFDEIRSAYRQRAKQYHPDYFGHDSLPFLGVQEAYDVLGDPSNRNSYDRRLRAAGVEIESVARPEPVVVRSRRPAVEPLKSARGPMDLGGIFPQTSFRSFRPSFDEIFDSLWNLGRPAETKGERFRTLTMEIRLTRDQADRGGRLQVRMPVRRPCATCGGAGDVGPFQCWNCIGTGVDSNEISIEVEYPAGIQDLYRIAIPLDRYGMPDFCAVLLFRISAEGDLSSSW